MSLQKTQHSTVQKSRHRVPMVHTSLESAWPCFRVWCFLSHYRPNVMSEMRIIGVDTKKLTKTKAVLMVKFLTPQSLKDSTMQMYCTSLAVSAKVLTLVSYRYKTYTSSLQMDQKEILRG